MRVVLFLTPALLLAACGTPQIGSSCSETGFLCDNSTNAMECITGKWTELPCRGVGGCAVASGQVTCDMSGDVAGDACASTAEGLGLCTAAGTATLECRNGTLVQTNVCTSCAVTNGQVTCQQ
jgi:hypothetical protein